MRFALVNNKRIEAEKGLNGICPGCFKPVIAKCGEKKIHHWAHKRSEVCDSWWENETQWHRDWKDNFPKECQEVFLPDTITGEKHIADVKTTHDIIIEFQHSAIDPQEQRAREEFYKNMIWVVDGTRLKLDYRRFCKWKNNDLLCLHQTEIKGVYLMDSPECWFNKSWIDSKVLVVFDFGEQESKGLKQLVWCLLPGRIGCKAVVINGTKDGLIKRLNEFSQPLPWSTSELMRDLRKIQKEKQSQRYIRKKKSYSIQQLKRFYWSSIRKRRK